MDPLKKLLGKSRLAITDYNMIQNNDKIAIGLSGGKDSLILALLLKKLSMFLPEKFEVLAICLDLGFDDFQSTKIKEFCEFHDIPIIIEKTKISTIVFDIQKPKSPCALCSNLRRGALNNAAIANGCNKVALGHHLDDLIETFYLSMLYEGRLSVFAPVTYLTRTNINVIRPMIYIHENEIISAIYKKNISPFKNPCRIDGHSKRALVKNLLNDLYIVNPAFKNNIFNMILTSNINGWKKPVSRFKK